MHESRPATGAGGIRGNAAAVRDAVPVPELAGWIYIPKLYKIEVGRASVVELLERGIEASGGRVVYRSFGDQRVAPIYIGAKDGTGGCPPSC